MLLTHWVNTFHKSSSNNNLVTKGLVYVLVTWDERQFQNFPLEHHRQKDGPRMRGELRSVAGNCPDFTYRLQRNPGKGNEFLWKEGEQNIGQSLGVHYFTKAGRVKSISTVIFFKLSGPWN